MTQESHTGIIDLSEDEPEIVALLIQYMYEGEYDPALPSTTKQAAATVLTTPVKRGEAVQKQGLYSYSFPHTCSHQHHNCLDDRICPHHRCGYHCEFICREYTCDICGMPPLRGSSSQLLTHTKMYEVAEKYEVTGLKDLAKEKFSRSCRHFWNTCNFPVAANHAFSTTPESDNGLRDLVSQTIATHMQLTREPEVRASLMQFNGLALGILDAKSEELGWVATDTVKGV